MAEKKKIFTDVIWSVLALGVMHGVLQLAVYPYLNKRLGADAFGNMLYVLAILGIFAPSIGLAANNTRLLERREHTIRNGDLMLAMLPQLAAALVLYIWLIFPYLSGGLDYLLAILTLVFTMLRSYGGVEYRMSLDYKGYFVYYLTISAGYLLGALLLPVTGNWMLCFLLGELFCFLLLFWKGSIYCPLERSEHWKRVLKNTLILTGSYTLYNTVLYLDRLLLQNLMDSETVTVYYVASLLGKTAALLVGPLNGVIIGHLTKDSRQITKKLFIQTSGVILGAGAVLYVGILVVCPIFTRLFYPDIADPVLEIAWVANLSQVLCFVASPLLTVMLTFCGTKWNLLVQTVYALLFIPGGYLGVSAAGLPGFITAGLVVNFLRVVLVFVVGLAQIRKKERTV